MAKTCKFYKYQKYASYDSGATWSPLDEYQRGELYEVNSPDCGGGTTYYRWVNLDPSTDYYCSGTTKLYKQKKQYSYDNENWTDVSPAQYQSGSTYQYQSTDCGYVPPTGYSTQYLTFVAQEDGRFRFSSGGTSYSLDSGSTWTKLSSDTLTPTIHGGETVMWKGTLTASLEGIGHFWSTGRFTVEGNAMSLLFGDNFIGQTDLTDRRYAFKALFSGCTGVTSVENLSLPATTLSIYCYSNMFDRCTNLTTVPSLPAMTLAQNCYQEMFYRCTSLTTAPQLPATTLAYYCYHSMFQGCTSLTTAPSVLPATTLASYCYQDMFKNCTRLATAPTLPATTLANSCYYAMFRDCTSLTTAPQLPATTLASSCYQEMFARCTSLTTAPQLPATTLASSCYYNMFAGCTNLTTAPSLPATTLADFCYESMFYYCTSLTTAPELPATTLANECYESMFARCTSLSYIKCLATDISANRCTIFWADRVASNGTFVKAANMTGWTRGISGIPSYWTVQDAS